LLRHLWVSVIEYVRLSSGMVRGMGDRVSTDDGLVGVGVLGIKASSISKAVGGKSGCGSSGIICSTICWYSGGFPVIFE